MGRRKFGGRWAAGRAAGVRQKTEKGRGQAAWERVAPQAKRQATAMQPQGEERVQAREMASAEGRARAELARASEGRGPGRVKVSGPERGWTASCRCQRCRHCCRCLPSRSSLRYRPSCRSAAPVMQGRGVGVGMVSGALPEGGRHGATPCGALLPCTKCDNHYAALLRGLSAHAPHCRQLCTGALPADATPR